jgi:hypothetical protein
VFSKRILPAAILSVLFAQSVFAQNTGSGAMVPAERTTADILQSIFSLAPNRNPLRLKDIQINELKLKGWEGALKTGNERLAAHRSECREAIRRANRDQLMDRTTQCMRGDLLQDIAMLRIRSQMIAATPMVDPLLKAAATGAIAKLTDAQMTIVDAIDTGLFEQTTQMEEAKKNLRLTYREPVWSALTRLRADRQLTWSIFMSKRIHERLTGPASGTGQSLAFQDPALCLESGALLLDRASILEDRQGASAMIAAAQLGLSGCHKTLLNIAKKEGVSSSSSSTKSLR